jgi:hypothetical protein
MMKKNRYLCLGIVLVLAGALEFFIGTEVQTVVIGFSLSCMGAIIVGWNLA